MKTVHLIDGTYELFRQYFARPERLNSDGLDIGAARAVVRGMVTMLEEGATHMGIATDHVIESFRNELYESYKDGAEMDPGIRNQFGPLEDGLMAAGFKVFPMVEYEADDAMAAAAAIADADESVDKVLICTPDKDLAQCVKAGRVLQFDRRNNKILDVAEVKEKYGVPPESIADWLGLVGDSADGFPGLKGWGAKSAATVLAHYGHIENIPLAAGQWEVTVRSAAKLAETLAANIEDAMLFKTLATLALEAPTVKDVEEMRWTGPAKNIEEWAAKLEAPDLIKRTAKLAEARR